MQDWKKIHLRSTGWLVLSTLFGIPLGLLLLTSSHQRVVKATLGVIIITFSTYSLIGRTPLELRRDSRGWLLACGFCAGVLGEAYGMNGPPLVLYGAMRRWSAQHFRATLQGYFLPASIIGMGGYWLAGLWVPAVTHYYLLSLPVHATSRVPRQSDQSSPAWRGFSKVHLPRLGKHRSALVGSGNNRPTLSVYHLSTDFAFTAECGRNNFLHFERAIFVSVPIFRTARKILPSCFNCSQLRCRAPHTPRGCKRIWSMATRGANRSLSWYAL